MATAPNFTKRPRNGRCTISAANTARDGTGTLVDLLVADATDGSMGQRITICATGNTTAGMIRFFIHDGTAYDLKLEIPVTAVTASATVAAFTATITPNWILATGMSIHVSTQNAQEFRVTLEGGDFNA